MRHGLKEPATRNRRRERRFDIFATLAWRERRHAQQRTLHGLENFGLAIRFQIQLREAPPASAMDDVAGTFRNAGFIVDAAGYQGISVIGEPCLALAFMFSAAKAGKLSREFEHFLDRAVGRQSQLRDEDHAHVLRSLSHTLAAIESVHPPR